LERRLSLQDGDVIANANHHIVLVIKDGDMAAPGRTSSAYRIEPGRLSSEH
jgi:hypothetical protein